MRNNYLVFVVALFLGFGLLASPTSTSRLPLPGLPKPELGLAQTPLHMGPLSGLAAAEDFYSVEFAGSAESADFVFTIDGFEMPEQAELVSRFGEAATNDEQLRALYEFLVQNFFPSTDGQQLIGQGRLRDFLQGIFWGGTIEIFDWSGDESESHAVIDRLMAEHESRASISIFVEGFELPTRQTLVRQFGQAANDFEQRTALYEFINAHIVPSELGQHLITRNDLRTLMLAALTILDIFSELPAQQFSVLADNLVELFEAIKEIDAYMVAHGSEARSYAPFADLPMIDLFARINNNDRLIVRYLEQYPNGFPWPNCDFLQSLLREQYIELERFVEQSPDRAAELNEQRVNLILLEQAMGAG